MLCLCVYTSLPGHGYSIAKYVLLTISATTCLYKNMIQNFQKLQANFSNILLIFLKKCFQT